MFAMKQKKAGMLALLLAAALLLTGIEIPVSAAETEEAPDSNVYQTIDGGTQAMWSSERKLTIAVFGTTSCQYTPMALQYLDAVGFSKDDVDLCYIDMSHNSQEQVREFAENMVTSGITYCYDDKSANATKAAMSYNLKNSGQNKAISPTYVFTDNTGKVRKIIDEAKDSAEIARAVEEIGFEELIPDSEKRMSVKFDVTYNQTDARAMLARINEFRTGDNAWVYSRPGTTTKEYYHDLQELTYDYELEKIAMQRAAELVAAYSHTRPDKTPARAAYTDAFANLGIGENIAVSTAADYPEAAVFEDWKEEDKDYYGQGHRRNMLSKDFKAIGVAHVVYNGCHYWVQEFSSDVVDGTETTAIDSKTKVKIDIARSAASYGRTLRIESATIKIEAGESQELPKVTDVIRTRDTYEAAPSLEIPVTAEWSVSSGEDTVRISDGRLTALKDGKAVIKAAYDGLETSVTVIVGQDSGENLPGDETVSEDLANPYYNVITDRTTWSYLYMGSYPQSEIKDADLKAAIDQAVGETVTDDCTDVWVKYNGSKNKYRKIKIRNKYQYFKWEPIRWKLMQKKTEGEPTTLYLIADKGLDAQYFNKTEDASKGTESTWEESTLRTWLNTEFYNMAFGTEAKQAFIESTETATAGDRVSILSGREARLRKYGFRAEYSLSDSRVVERTNYAMARDLYGGNLRGGVWWLQSEGMVSGDGRFYGVLYNNPRICVPVVRINMNAENAWSFYAKDITIEQTLAEECQEKLAEYEDLLSAYDEADQEALREILAQVQAELEKAQTDGDREAANAAMAKMEEALKEKAQAKKDAAKQELEDIRSGIQNEEYDEKQKAEIEAVISEAETAIENAPDAAAIKAELEKVNAKIEEIKQAAQWKGKAEQQISDWQAETFLAKYDQEEQEQLKGIAEKLKTDLESETQAAKIQKLLEDAQAEVEKIQTIEQKEKENSLKKEREKALEELNTLEAKLSEYRATEKRKISAAIKTARTKIGNAQDEETIKTALAEVNRVVSGCKTDAQLKAEEASNNKTDTQPKEEAKKVNISRTGSAALSASSYTYNGKLKNPGVTVTVNGKRLTANKDYTVSYQNNKNVGTASVIVTGIGGYEGTLTRTFTIVPKGTSVSKLTGQSKRFIAQWKKQTTSVTGYEISYSTSKKFTKKTTVTKKVGKKTTTKLTVKKLKAKKKYYVRVRTYKTVKGKKYVSSWSKVKTVTTKK